MSDDDDVADARRSTCPRLRSPGWSLAGADETANSAAAIRSRSQEEDGAEKEYLDLRRQDWDGVARRPPPRPPVSAVVDDHGRLVSELYREMGRWS